MNKSKLILVVLVLIIVLGIAGYFVYVRSDEGGDNLSKNDVSQGDKNTESGIAQKDANAEQVVFLDLVDELIAKRKKMGHAVYTFDVITTNKEGKVSTAENLKTLWDDYNNYGVERPDGFAGVNKGLLYTKIEGVIKFNGVISKDTKRLLTPLIFENYIFDNLLLDVKNDPENSSFLGEETINSKKYFIFSNKLFGSDLEEEMTRKFWVSAEDGTVLKEEMEEKVKNAYYDPQYRSYVMTMKFEMKAPPVFSRDKKLIDTVLIVQAKYPDSDKDGLVDDVEKNIFNTDPNNPDTDGDGHKDGDEIDAGYDPNVKSPDDKLLD